MLENLHKPIGRELLISSMSNKWKPDNGYTLQTSTPWFPYGKKRTSKISKTFHDVDEAVLKIVFQSATDSSIYLLVWRLFLSLQLH